MRASSLFMLVLAILFGSAAVFVTNLWLDSQRASISGSAQASLNPTATLVVAATPLKFGDTLQPDNLREIVWPSGNVPDGAFSTIDELLKEGARQALRPFERDEPVLASKITGPGQRASLSAIVDSRKKAMTIRVNDVLGVAGFVLPGDRVDIMLTRGDAQGGSYVDVLLQGVKVLAIDQTADESRDDPQVARAVTVEVDTEQAQKLTLAANVGQLSLALRNIAQGNMEETRRVTMSDLNEGEIALPPPTEIAPPIQKPRAPIIIPKVGVVRGTARTEYEVPSSH